MSSNLLLIEAARRLVASSRYDDAEYVYAKLLEASPSEMEAVAYVSSRALARGQAGRAIQVLEQAAAQSPGSADIQRELGIAYKFSGRLDAALDALSKAATLNQSDYLSRLLLGHMLENLGNSYGALTHYFGALAIAQMNGAWFDEATTPPGQSDLVKHATRYVCAGRAELLANVMAPLIARHGPSAMERVTQSIAIYLGDAPANYADSRQQPLFFYMPGLPTHPYFDRSFFDWMEELESKTDPIRLELRSVLAAGDRLEPFHGALSDKQLAHYLANPDGKPNWDSYFFYRHGNRFESHCDECPNTIAALDRVPLARIREHAPESMFSVLTPGTHILPHRGVTNTRLVAHLPLIVPENCAIVVGGETHVWQEGRVVVFDDTFEHEAWNRSAETRTVLILDIWNPYLDESERDALTRLVPAIGDFNRDCGL